MLSNDAVLDIKSLGEEGVSLDGDEDSSLLLKSYIYFQTQKLLWGIRTETTNSDLLEVVLLVEAQVALDQFRVLNVRLGEIVVGAAGHDLTLLHDVNHMAPAQELHGFTGSL